MSETIMCTLRFATPPVARRIAEEGRYKLLPLDLWVFDSPGLVGAARAHYPAWAGDASSAISEALSQDEAWLPDMHHHDEGIAASLREAIVHTASEVLPRQHLFIDAMTKIIEQTQPSLLLLADDLVWASKTLALLARSLGVPTLHIPHAHISANPDPELRDIHDISVASRLAVYGSRMRDYYAGHGYPAEDIAVTGNPLWDPYATFLAQRDSVRDWFLRSVNLDPRKPTVLYATTFMEGSDDAVWTSLPGDHFDVFLAAMVAIREQHDVQLVIKPHPNIVEMSRMGAMRRAALAAGLDGVAVTPAKEAALASCDLIVHTESNIAIEGMLLGVPSVSMALGWDRAASSLYRDDDPVLHIHDVDALQPAIASMLFDQAELARVSDLMGPAVERYNFLNDGGATDRVLALIDDMLA